MSDEIVNRVTKSGLITIDLKDYYPNEERVLLDISNKLYQGLVLRENEFREYVSSANWESYTGKYVAIICSADAIVPTWAYMLLSVHLQPYAKRVFFGTLDQLNVILMQEQLSKIDFEPFRDARVIIKGCSDLPIPIAAYVELTVLLRPYAKSIMYGEPCSTVPLYKKK